MEPDSKSKSESGANEFYGKMPGYTVSECENMIDTSFTSLFPFSFSFGSLLEFGAILFENVVSLSLLLAYYIAAPMVKFLREHLHKSGCNVERNFIKAINCKYSAAGGYARGLGIVVCSNHVQLQDEVTQVVIHELIHAYDDCRGANLDWNNCAHHACSEIRANHLSGDCHYKREFLRGYLRIRGHEKDCVRRRAMASVSANPSCSKEAAKNAMDAVWDVCYNDTKPFDRAP